MSATRQNQSYFGVFARREIWVTHNWGACPLIDPLQSAWSDEIITTKTQYHMQICVKGRFSSICAIFCAHANKFTLVFVRWLKQKATTMLEPWWLSSITPLRWLLAFDLVTHQVPHILVQSFVLSLATEAHLIHCNVVWIHHTLASSIGDLSKRLVPC